MKKITLLSTLLLAFTFSHASLSDEFDKVQGKWKETWSDIKEDTRDRLNEDHEKNNPPPQEEKTFIDELLSLLGIK